VLTGDGLAQALSGADALVDVSIRRVRRRSGHGVLHDVDDEPGRRRQGRVGHYVALSIVGVTDYPTVATCGLVQETIITNGVPYTILRATQFAEFTDAITDSTAGDEVRYPMR
jgi:uncharacterized protein YbjT (DUF2867 family)